uniref:1-acylglycerol-3-phosphate O-acyltransferase n=3 Tax=Brassica oleracea TaxID=3712 RepID=A0A0D3AQL0_BRAOL
RRLSGGRRKSVSFEDLSSRRLFRPCRILPIRLVDLRYTLPSLIISLIRFGSFYETLVLRFTFIHSFLCSIITFYPSSFLPSSPTWLHPPSPSNFSRFYLEKMEVTGDSDNLKNRSLTPVRTLRGLIILLIFLSTAFMFLIYFAPPFALALRLLSVHQSRKSISFIFGHWLALWPYLFETINGTTVIFSGDTLPVEKRVLLIANHRTEVDWMYLWNIALRKGCLGYIKYVLKSSLMRLPIFGWGFHVLEFIPVERKREVDEPVMLQMLSSFKDPREPLWLALFPEGTDFTEEKCKRSQKFAAEAGLPTLSNVLLPKTRGFSVCLDALHNSLDAVYDLTIAYKPRCPSFMDNVFGTDPSEVHIHVKRVLTKEIPASEAESSAWLMDSFKSKDRLLSDFNAQGQFPNQRPEEELSILKCIATFGVIVSLTVLFLYLTLYSHSCFKVYVGLSFTYLSFATYYKFRPSPSVGCCKGGSSCKEAKTH